MAQESPRRAAQRTPREIAEWLPLLPRGRHPGDPDASLPAGDMQLIFGSFNTLEKVTPEVVRTWAAILGRIPDSRLLLKADALADAPTRGRVLGDFAAHGVAPERIELLAWVPDYARHMALYGRVNIGPDPFPFNGATTTCEALWMGKCDEAIGVSRCVWGDEKRQIALSFAGGRLVLRSASGIR